MNPDERARTNTLWARTFVDGLARAGVRHLCLAPGSRSTPLVMAAARDERIRVLTQLDERSAAFLALGVGRASRRPAAVLTTSGTAAANLYPAVVEAAQSEVPLLLLTADRPHRLRDADANQAVDQVRLYGTYPRAFFDVPPARSEDRDLRHLRQLAARAVALAAGTPAGPVHLNFPFEKPLEPVEPVEQPQPVGPSEPGPSASAPARGRTGPWVDVTEGRSTLDPEVLEELRSRLAGAERPLLVAGPHSEAGALGPAATVAARALGVPLLADPLSGARHGADADAPVIGAYDLLLRSPAVRRRLRPDVVLRVGASPTSASLLAHLEESADAEHVVVDAGGRWKDHLAVASRYLRADPVRTLEALAEGGSPPTDARSAWSTLWRRLERTARDAAAAAMAAEAFEGSVASELVERLPAGATLFVSSSMPVRDVDAYGFARAEPLEVLGNRGASGIDGIVSTALGVSAVREEPVVCLIGDLALIHDMNGLLAARMHGLEVVFVVVQNDGGGIFHLLPIREHEPEFTPYFATPHGLDFEHAARLHGVPHRRLGSGERIGDLLTEALEAGGTRLLEVPSDRERNRERQRAVERAVAEAVADVLDGAVPAG